LEDCCGGGGFVGGFAPVLWLEMGAMCKGGINHLSQNLI
jgi:hypothetical protein